MGRVLVRRRPTFDVASLPWNLLLKEFDGTSPWEGSDSAGVSGDGSHDATSGALPTLGSQNGKPTAIFNGTTNYLQLDGNGLAYLEEESFSGYFVFKPTAAQAQNYLDPAKEVALFTDNGGTVGVNFSAAGVGAFHHTPSEGWKATYAACPIDEWAVATFAWDGAAKRLRVGVNGPPNHSMFCLPESSSLGVRTMYIGRNCFDNADAKRFKGEIAESGIFPGQRTDQHFRDIVASADTRYALSLTIQESNVASSPVTGPLAPVRTYAATTHTLSAPFEQRDGAKLHYMNSRLWLLGGWASSARATWGNMQTTNQVWSCPDVSGVPDLAGGWVLSLPHASSPPASGPGARWLPGHAFGTAQFNLGDGAGECIYVVGCDQYPGAPPYIFRSNDPGNANGWVQRIALAPFRRRVGLIVGQRGTELHILGGLPYESGNYYPAVSSHHVSYDGGLTLIQLPDAPFSTSFVTNAIEHQGCLVVMGGNGGAIASGTRVYQNFVWVFDGSKWHRQDSGNPWPAAMWIDIASYDGRLWRVAGRFADGPTDDDNALFSSRDFGSSWGAHATPPWPGSHADGICVHPHWGIVLASGYALEKGVYSYRAT